MRSVLPFIYIKSERGLLERETKMAEKDSYCGTEGLTFVLTSNARFEFALSLKVAI